MNNRYKKGQIVKGTVSGVENYGIFVKIDDDYSGLIHISEISDKFVKDPETFAQKNDQIHVEILEVNNNKSQLKLSIKNIEYKEKIPKKKQKIIETEHGFETLEKKLPIWIKEKINTL